MENWPGTSMAAPHVAGCWAILKQGKPTASVEEMKQVLISTGVPVTDWRNGITKPRIDCKAALDRLTGTTALAGTPDLKIASSTVSPTNVTTGAQISISASVANAGTASSAATTVRYYVSSDPTISTSDSALSCLAPVSALAQGQSVSAETCAINVPSTPGPYYYGACVVSASGEINTSNNCSNGTLVSVASPSLPDLIIESISGSSQATVGGPLTISLTVKNRGTGPSAASRVNVYLSADSTITSSDSLVAFADVPALAAGTSHPIPGHVTVASSVLPRAYYLGAVADSANVVTETDETNNTRAASVITQIDNTTNVPSLGDGVDTPGVAWITGGDSNWSAVTDFSNSGGDSVRSGTVGANQLSYMQTTATGPGTLSFYWKVSSESGYDGLVFVLDSEFVDYISGEVDWTQKSVSVPSGVHTITWAYFKDESVSAGLDAGWVDRVTFSAGGSSLTVATAGLGSGRVTSLPNGIDCGSDCREVFASGTVKLTATPDYGYVFAGWGGDCSGTSDCVLDMSASRTAYAWFTTKDDRFPPSPLPQGWSWYPTGSQVPWQRVYDQARGGLYSLRSGAIGDSGVSAITFSGAFTDGVIRFAAKVSSESDYDYLKFYIDGNLIDWAAGEMDWVDVGYPIGAGQHTLAWVYRKDSALSDGADAAWIDSVSLPLASSAGVLATPANGSTVSGVSVISGYHCTSKNITVEIDGVSIGKAGAGTTLNTISVCGHAEAGYSLLYNFNNLANGSHTVKAYADGVLLGTNTVTTTKSGGTAWLSGASKATTVSDFPQAGQTTSLQWVQSYQNFLVTGISGVSAGPASTSAGSAAPAASVGSLGTPGDGTTVSGVGVISGYHCTSKDIDIEIDGVKVGKAGAGTTLLGTQSVCGRTDTGYSLLYNFNNLANGTHTIAAYADGRLLKTNVVTTFRSGNTAFLSGANKSVTVRDFPQTGQTVTLQWVQSYQNFLITGIVGP
jgi:hypothetical protein